MHYGATSIKYPKLKLKYIVAGDKIKSPSFYYQLNICYLETQIFVLGVYCLLLEILFFFFHFFYKQCLFMSFFFWLV